MKIRLVSMAAMCLALTACGGDDAPQDVTVDEIRSEARSAAENMPANIEDAVDDLVDAFSGKAMETVSASDLKGMLPESISGMKRVRASGSKSGAMGFKISNAEAFYEGNDPQDDQTVTVKISDLGSMQKMARMGLDWLSVEVDEESDQGFYRTTTYKGFQALESYEDNGSSANTQLMVFIDGRFLVDVAAENLEFDDVKDVLDSLPVQDLGKMAGG
ncbi:MAG: hypothetical protein AB8G17_03650 [Gammaproteobacteria bacterium]